MPTVRNMLVAATERLLGDDAHREAEILLARTLGMARAWLFAHADADVDDARREMFDALIERRTAGEPVAYLTGIRGFHALELEVTPDVLIPRPETELLVELALQRIRTCTECAVADLGTGSGAIALAIAKARPHARVLATDASEAALAIATRNANRLGICNVEFARGDWCKALGDARFDVIGSNPPYIAESDPHLREGDLRFEPRAALASGGDGLDAIRIIAAGAGAHLRDGGGLLLEHGFEQGAAVRRLLEKHGYRDVFTRRDLGSHERVSGGHL